MNKPKKCVLAYSGGLDTSAIVVWLIEAGYEVHCVLVDVGQDERLEPLCDKALRFGATTAIVHDAKPMMLSTVVPYAIGLGATYEGSYRLGTALARPAIAWAQVQRAKALGGATLVHGATGKGNDQIRFEFAYRALAPECPVLAPWKVWPFQGRADLVQYLEQHGRNESFAVTKTFSLDENLWHLSIEGGPLEQPAEEVDVAAVIAHFDNHFYGTASTPGAAPASVRIGFVSGVPVSLDGVAMPLEEILAELNKTYRHAPWAWDLVIENRFTGVKSRGVYLNPAAKLLHLATDAMARASMNKPTYDEYVALGHRYGQILYRGEYFASQRVAVEAMADALFRNLTGEVTLATGAQPYASAIKMAATMFTKDLATFEASTYDHRHAEGFIALSWLSSIGQPFEETAHEHPVEEKSRAASDVCHPQRLPARGLVPAAP